MQKLKADSTKFLGVHIIETSPGPATPALPTASERGATPLTLPNHILQRHH